ncbi:MULTISPECIES: hypothetical protein [unclassified Streptomyces]|uniref:hypothetical protein n=1 Tax=unclassified Streptomyces TaxID=2593676 RepID=UPI00081D777D|nr:MULTISPECIES: hypothetical protein [unclassified Streptomyces]SCD85536.1 hypothetical protein GA0115243_1044101 [Streptomyces sp. ScaeMP-e83]
MVRVSTTGPISGRAAFAALTTGTARSVAAAAHCGDLPQKPGPLVPPVSDEAPSGPWSCRLFLDDGPSGIVRAAGFMTYTASRDPLFAAAVRKAPGTARGKAPDGGAAEVVNAQKMILPCAQGDPLYLAVRPGLRYLEAREPHRTRASPPS